MTKPSTDWQGLDGLTERLGRTYVRLRLGLESDHEQRIFGYGLNVLHFHNEPMMAAAIARIIKLCGMYERGYRNAERIALRHNTIEVPTLPASFDGFTVLHLSDLHIGIHPGALARLLELLESNLNYDACVLTGDYRAATHGPFDAAVEGLRQVAERLTAPAYAVLGNHDSVRMVPAMEQMGLRVLINECDALTRGDARIHISGIDDAHYFRVHNIEKAASQVPPGEFAVLLSHSPEVYRQAAHAGFAAMLSGHTHGGQICLPGGNAVTLEAVLPREFGAGPWRHRGMAGYTSVGAGTSMVPVRFNCPPEITLHRFTQSPNPPPA